MEAVSHQRHSGEIDAVVANARIRAEGADYVADELFDVRIKGTTASLLGGVDPDARWTADSTTLRLDTAKGELAGMTVDDSGASGTVRFARAR